MRASIDDATPEEWDAIVQAHHAGIVAQGDDKSDHLLRRLNAALENPFGEVPIYWRCIAFAFQQQGHRVEFAPVGGEWSSADSPDWCAALRYRVLAKPEELVLPSIDWSHVSQRYTWLTQDASGVVVLFDHQPKPSGPVGVWTVAVSGGQFLRADNFASAKAGKGDWTKLIVQRPEGV